MTRFEIIDKLKEYFVIQELVSPVVYRRHGDRAWKFFSTDILHALYILRVGLDKPIIINDWHRGGRFTQRGLRTNLDNIFIQAFKRGKLYLSGHVLGEAFDLDVVGMKAYQVRCWILDNADLFPTKLRLEHLLNNRPIEWVHIDTIQEEHNPKVYLFDV